jgi:hypothetical protein
MKLSSPASSGMLDTSQCAEREWRHQSNVRRQPQPEICGGDDGEDRAASEDRPGDSQGQHEAPLVQDTLPISLFLVSRLMNDWVTVDEVVDFLFPEQVRQELPVPACGDIAARLAYSRILRPLLWMGLLEDRKWDEGSLTKTELRKTDLFDRVLQFNVKVSSTTGYLH